MRRHAIRAQTPSLRAEQNGKKKELLRALADEKAEIAYLLKADDDPAELRAYAAARARRWTSFLRCCRRRSASRRGALVSIAKSLAPAARSLVRQPNAQHKLVYRTQICTRLSSSQIG